LARVRTFARTGLAYSFKAQIMTPKRFNDIGHSLVETGYIDEALNELDQEDPLLIEAIRRMLIKPALVSVKPRLDLDTLVEMVVGHFVKMSVWQLAISQVAIFS
jgi:hypothetical protein